MPFAESRGKWRGVRGLFWDSNCFRQRLIRRWKKNPPKNAQFRPKHRYGGKCTFSKCTRNTDGESLKKGQEASVRRGEAENLPGEGKKKKTQRLTGETRRKKNIIHLVLRLHTLAQISPLPSIWRAERIWVRYSACWARPFAETITAGVNQLKLEIKSHLILQDQPPSAGIHFFFFPQCGIEVINGKEGTNLCEKKRQQRGRGVDGRLKGSGEGRSSLKTWLRRSEEVKFELSEVGPLSCICIFIFFLQGTEQTIW